MLTYRELRFVVTFMVVFFCTASFYVNYSHSNHPRSVTKGPKSSGGTHAASRTRAAPALVTAVSKKHSITHVVDEKRSGGGSKDEALQAARHAAEEQLRALRAAREKKVDAVATTKQAARPATSATATTARTRAADSHRHDRTASPPPPRRTPNPPQHRRSPRPPPSRFDLAAGNSSAAGPTEKSMAFDTLSNRHFTHTHLGNFIKPSGPRFASRTFRGSGAYKNVAPRQLFVMSPGESGDSLVTRLLMAAGAYGGERDDFHLYGSNEVPYELWERRDVGKLSSHMVESSVNSSLDVYETAVGFKLSRLPKRLVQFFRSRWRRITEQMDKRAGARPWVIKEPRTCVLSPLYFKDLSDVACVLVYRHPHAYAQSLLRRRFTSWKSFEWIAVWEKYHLEALRGCHRRPKVLVRHDDLLREPIKTMRLLVDDLRTLGVKIDKMDAQLEQWITNWMPRFADIPTSDSVLSREQRELVRAYEVGNIVHWNLASTLPAAAVKGARGSDDGLVWTESLIDMTLPQERIILGYGDGDAVSHSMVPLREVLPEVALPGTKDVIAVYGNHAFADMIKNLVCNFHTIHVMRYVIFALDVQLCPLLRVVDAPCYYDQEHFGSGVADIQYWSMELGSTYYRLLQMKMSYVGQVLRSGHNLLLVDADIAFSENVLPFIHSKYGEYDLVLQSDARRAKPETSDWVCAGFFYCKTNERTLKFIAEIDRIMAEHQMLDQDVFQLVLTGHAQKLSETVDTASINFTSAADLGVKWAVLDQALFPNGWTLFDEDYPRSQHVSPLMAHANGRPLKKKMKDMTRYNVWFLNEDMDGCQSVQHRKIELT